jgi:hypothetical protein
VIEEPAAVEDDGTKALFLEALGNDLADRLRPSNLGRPLTRSVNNLLLEVARRDDGVPCLIVNDLGVDVGRRTKDVETRPLRRPVHLRPHADVAPLASVQLFPIL